MQSPNHGIHLSNLAKLFYYLHGAPCSKLIKDPPSEQTQELNTKDSTSLGNEETVTITEQRVHAPMMVVHTSKLSLLHLYMRSVANTTTKQNLSQHIDAL